MLRAATALAAIAACAQPALGASSRTPPRHPQPRAHASVVGGTPAPAGSWQFMAFVANVTGGTACSGTVVSPMLVLTAAHCAEDISSGTVTPAADFRVVTGALDWTENASGQVLDVAQVDIDPTFDATTLDDDAALLVLAAPTRAPAIALAGPSQSSLLSAGTSAQLAGWGYTYLGETTPPTALYQASTVVQASGYCTTQETLDGVLFDPAENVCAVDDPGFDVAACHGDSGGPLVASAADGTSVEIAITSHGDPNCNPSYPSVFTRADAVYGWVEQEIADTPAPVSAPAPAGAGTTAAAATGASDPAPPAAATTTPHPAAPPAPDSGVFAGRTAQAGGRVSLSVDGARLRSIAIDFTLRCGQRSRPHLHAVSTRAVAVSLARGAWKFTAAFSDGRGWRYRVGGSFSSPTQAAGTISVRTRDGACTARAIRWTARSS